MERARNARTEALAKEEAEKGPAPEDDNELARTTSIMNLDFGVDRLFPDTAKKPDGLSWADPSLLNDATFPISTTNGLTDLSTGMTDPAMTILPLQNGATSQSIDATLASDATTAGPSSFSLPMMSNDWLSNIADPTFDPNLAATSPVGGGSPLLPDGSVNWASWDDMVSQFGMDLDSNQVNAGQPLPFGSTFSGLTQWY